MSYILDALRRSQAERERGRTPGLHTPAGAPPGLAVPRPRRMGGWAVAALALAVALALGGWRFWPMAQPRAVVPAPAPAAQAGPAPAPNPVPMAPLPVQSAGVPAPLTEPAAARAEPPQRALPPAPQPQPKTRVAREAEHPRQVRAGSTAAPVPAAAQQRPPAPQEEAAAAAPVFAQSDLPPAVQAQLPKLQLAGVTYSSNPKFRMVIVNGQVLHEGDQAAPGLRLERIEQGRTVWSFRGYRYALAAQ
jgi:general secretion pathway protein B